MDTLPLISARRLWLLVGLVVAACAGVVVAPALAPAATPTVVVTPLGASADGDSLRYRLTWQWVSDSRGAPEYYAASVLDSAGVPVVAEHAATEATTVVTVPAPAWGATARYTARVYSVRRGLRSPSPATVTWPVTRADIAPPAPGGLQATPVPPSSSADLEVLLVGTTDTLDCRPLVASTLARVDSDTAWFVRALPGIPEADVHVYCVANALVVGLDGWVGDAHREPDVYAAGAPLPTEGPAREVLSLYRGA